MRRNASGSRWCWTELAEKDLVIRADRPQVRVVRRQGLLEDCQGALVERLGLGIAAGGPVELSEVVEVSG